MSVTEQKNLKNFFSRYVPNLITLYRSQVHVFYKVSNILLILIGCFVYQLIRLLPWNCPFVRDAKDIKYFRDICSFTISKLYN